MRIRKVCIIQQPEPFITKLSIYNSSNSFQLVNSCDHPEALPLRRWRDDRRQVWRYDTGAASERLTWRSSWRRCAGVWRLL